MNPYEAWVLQGRPIYARLPRERYHVEDPENPSNWLTRWFDGLLVSTKTKLDDLPRQLNATTCDADWLDFVAALSGFTGQYWDKAWPVSAKRVIASNANYIWSNKGTKQVLQLVLSAFSLQGEIWQNAGFYAGVTKLPATIGAATFRYYVRVPIVYARTGYEFRLVERLNRLFAPVFCKSVVCYDKWYAGLSLAGDPVF